ncbi:MAG TPA: site-specific integrase [Burkholderiales bacterium]|nr:site-specific integrase [Burkholderiales bacterium]
MAKKAPGIEERTNDDGSISFRARVRMRGFPHLSKTFSRVTDAKKWIQDIEAAIRGGTAVSNEAARTTLREAFERYSREVTPRKKGRRREQERINTWKQHPLSVRFLAQLRGADFAEYRDQRRAEGKAENTVRIELALISHLFEIARREWKMEGLRNPIKNVTMPAGSNRRERRLTPDEETALLTHLGGPYMASLASLAIETAMRRGELLALTWADINLQTGVARLHDTKNSERRDVPLSRRALEILKAFPRPIALGTPVFPLTQDFVSHAFRQACKNAGIENLHFHDLRHEAVSRICEKLPMHEAMRVTGHKTPSMLMRYYHPKAEDLARKLG